MIAGTVAEHEGNGLHQAHQGKHHADSARGAGVAVDFGLELVGAMLGKEAQAQIRASILCD